MALVQAGSFTSRSSAGVDSVNLGFQPKCVILFASRAGFSATDLSNGDVQNAVLITDGTTTRCAAVFEADNIATSDAGSGWFNELRCINAAGTAVMAAAISLTSTGFDLTFSTVTAGWSIGYLALGGADISAKVLSFSKAVGAGSIGVTGAGFTPKALFGISSLSTPSPNATQVHGFRMVGAADADVEEHGVGAASADASGVLDSSRILGTTGFFLLRASNNGSTTTNASITSYDADGFTINFATNVQASEYAVLCLAGAGLLDADLVQLAADTTTGAHTQTFSGLPFRPRAAIVFGMSHTATNTNTTSGSVALGFFDHQLNQASNLYSTRDASDPMDVMEGASSTGALVAHTIQNPLTTPYGAHGAVSAIGATSIDVAWGAGKTAATLQWSALLLSLTPTIVVGQAVETDTAQPVAVRPQKIPVGQALETDTATSLAKFIRVNQAVETDTAQDVSPRRSYPVGQALELDDARSLTPMPPPEPLGLVPRPGLITLTPGRPILTSTVEDPTNPGHWLPLEQSPLRVFHIKRANPWTVFAELSDSFARHWTDPLNDAGNGGAVLWNDDPALVDIDDGDLLRFTLYGRKPFTAIVETKTQKIVAPDEEVGEVTILDGRGVNAILEEALVYPTQVCNDGIDEARIIERTRIFNWVSPSYSVAAWPNARVLAVQGTRPKNSWSPGANARGPLNWPDKTAKYIWGYPGDIFWAPGGTCFFRKNLTIGGSSDVTVKMFWCADNRGQLYVDGVLIDSMELGSPLAAQNTHETVVVLCPGTHTIAIRVTNVGDQTPPDPYPSEHEDPKNPGLLLFAAYQMTTNEALGSLLLHSDETWRVSSYPDQAPGMTPGDILWICLAEAHDRGTIPEIKPAFTRDSDSDGRPWPEYADIETRVGNDLLTFAKELAATYIDFRVGPGSLKLYAWRKDGRGQNRAVSLVPSTGDASTGNLTDHTERFS